MKWNGFLSHVQKDLLAVFEFDADGFADVDDVVANFLVEGEEGAV